MAIQVGGIYPPKSKWLFHKRSPVLPPTDVVGPHGVPHGGVRCKSKGDLWFLLNPHTLSRPGNSEGRRSCLVGSEGRGGATLTFRGPDWTLSKIADGPGGNMAIIPMPHVSERLKIFFSSSTNSFPFFSPEGQRGLPCTPGCRIPPNRGKRWRLFDLPFLHRMDLVFLAGKPTIIVAALCGKKEFRDDWSSAGAVYAVEIGDDGSQCHVGKPILGGIAKNHGMFLRRKKEGEEVFVSGEEGVFSIQVPKVGEEWHSEKILDTPTGDVVLNDLDGDGQEEILAIHPFHGDTACVYNKAWGREWAAGVACDPRLWSRRMGRRDQGAKIRHRGVPGRQERTESLSIERPIPMGIRQDYPR